MRIRLATRSLARWSLEIPISPTSLVPNNLLTAHLGSVRGLAANFSMDLLKDLRTQSGAPIVDCKKALQAAGSDLSAAMDWLREHGAAKASSKVQGRETTEGLVGLRVSADGKSAALVKVASETDFAGRSSKFVDLLLSVADATLQSSKEGTLEEDTVLQANTDGKTVKELLDEAIVAIRENLSVADALRLESADGILVGYVHNRIGSSDAGTAAALVEVAPAKGKDVALEVLQSTGKKLAMHIVAARPQYLSSDDVPKDVVEKEKAILMKQNEDSGKPPEILEKIVDGRLRKFYEGICLTEQAHMIEDQNPKVSKVLQGLDIELKRFKALSIS